MKIQLPLENWSDVLPFVPRSQLGKIAHAIGDRQFATIVHFVLHESGEICLGCMGIDEPSGKGADGRPVVKIWSCRSTPKTLPPDAPVPKNIKNFKRIHLSYFDMSTLSFLQKFQQNSLLENANLFLQAFSLDEVILPFLANLLPSISSINSIKLSHICGWVYRTRAGNQYSQLVRTMLKRTRILEISYDRSSTELLYTWLYNVRDDGKPRVLLFFTTTAFLPSYLPKISSFIEHIRQDFLLAKDPSSFFIRLILGTDQWKEEGITLDNRQTREKLTIKKTDPSEGTYRAVIVVLISRYSLEATKQWIEANEAEALHWKWDEEKRQIYMSSLDYMDEDDI